MRVARRWVHLAILLPVFSALAGLVGCHGCEKNEAGSPEAQRAAKIEESNPRLIDVEIDLPIAQFPEGFRFEFGPADPEPWLQHAGIVDVADRYAAAVMIALKDSPTLVACSGVLVSPRLVLTAGSCVCAQSHSESAVTSGNALVSSSCAERVSVTTVVYGGNSGPEAQGEQLWLRTYEGSVRAHPDLQFWVDPRGHLRSRRADLAAISLNEPVPEQLAKVLLSGSEVRQGEALIMAGYGHDQILGGDFGTRYYRKNTATRAPQEDDDKLHYEQEGAYVYDGFAGGPCFREERGGQWLVGIAGVGSDAALTCTSTFIHREWLRAEIQRARREGSASP
ncbi:trypsin-like serine protease [Hyalangium sp.]|uniref:trypsin-like serine protease n=1 Tax=Hyalangium sp. TaxID=2028555 RepID=UPI002D2C2223|nr:trypsin-like serine protease [Hyalangium sp.]HYI00596.1 trypsin-like serine protease [Hyalangium sp.]